jgi:hypothetical protein
MNFFPIKSAKLVQAVAVKCLPMLNLIFVMNVSPNVNSIAVLDLDLVRIKTEEMTVSKRVDVAETMLLALIGLNRASENNLVLVLVPVLHEPNLPKGEQKVLEEELSVLQVVAERKTQRQLFENIDSYEFLF